MLDSISKIETSASLCMILLECRDLQSYCKSLSPKPNHQERCNEDGSKAATRTEDHEEPCGSWLNWMPLCLWLSLCLTSSILTQIRRRKTETTKCLWYKQVSLMIHLTGCPWLQLHRRKKPSFLQFSCPLPCSAWWLSWRGSSAVRVCQLKPQRHFFDW